ncbi:hypothetical protein ANAPH1_00518 [Anaplasma phagocytophilum]|nr:hypothetical protein ANAPH1_00518 [Anaplasma phagocytophilum]
MSTPGFVIGWALCSGSIIAAIHGIIIDKFGILEIGNLGIYY